MTPPPPSDHADLTVPDGSDFPPHAPIPLSRPCHPQLEGRSSRDSHVQCEAADKVELLPALQQQSSDLKRQRNKSLSTSEEKPDQAEKVNVRPCLLPSVREDASDNEKRRHGLVAPTPKPNK
ncbi:unnamed protein product [Pleuronectes platessa]|uniref:Uncharacterized protein n=1 Tax=Pleuronectes platessa TaxID=8262 RepID=A0A9N7TMT8_PLEPL|nr:unnamed protein product [Pleuronectes platessa]